MNLSGDWLYWLMLIGVLAVNAVLVYVAWWALFSDRSKSQRRCPQCWYDLAYSPGMTCGECGFTGRSEAQFHRTRRRYRLALFAILCSVLISGWVSDQLSQKGWVSMMPTRVLVGCLPLASSSNSSITAELASRVAMDQLSESQWHALLERCVTGDWQTSASTDAWAAKYGELIRSWRGRCIGYPDAERLLNGLSPQLHVTTREIWPSGAHAVAQVQLNDWWPWGTECRIRAVLRMLDADGRVVASAPPMTFYRTGEDRMARGDYPLPLPAISDDTRRVDIEFSIDRRRMDGISGRDKMPPEDWQPAHSQTISLPIRAQGDVATLLKPVDLPEQTAALTQAFAEGVVRFPSGRSPVRFRLELLHSFNAPFEDVAVGVNLMLYRDDVLARQLNVWWLGGSSPADRHYGYEVAYENLDLLPLATGDDGHRWHMVVRGDPYLALRVGAGAKHWAGEFDVPVEVAQSNQRAPRRAWWTEEEQRLRETEPAAAHRD